MIAPPDEAEILTDCVPVYVPATGLNVGVEACGLDEEFNAPASHVPEDGRALPALSLHKAVRTPVQREVRLVPRPMTGLPEFGIHVEVFRLGLVPTLLVSSDVAVCHALTVL